jgi:stage II sporulation protein D
MPRLTRAIWAAVLAALLGSAALAADVAPASGAKPAADGVRWVVSGRGFGHGVGMSQYGAYGYAKHGKGYRFILRHYYRGTRLATLGGARVVRVLLDIEGGDVGFGGATSACGRSLSPSGRYEAHRTGGSVLLRTAAGRTLARCGRKLRAAGRGTVEIDGLGTYRGALEVVPTHSDARSLNVIDALAVDQYVKGVVPNESPSYWPMAELRAQAIASRSFALSSQVHGNGFDLYSDGSSQVYKGLESETPRTNQAAAATRGQVVEYDGDIAQTLFSACSGGHTESAQNVFFGEPIPYLVGVPDPYDYYCPLHHWTLRFTAPQIDAKLAPYLDGRHKRVVVTQTGVTPRIMWAKLVGTRGTTKVRGDQLEAALGAYDTWMRFRKRG